MSTTSAHPDVLKAIADVLDEVAGTPRDQVVPEARFAEDLEVDSLTMVEVVTACEDRFGVRIPDEKLEELRTVGDAADFISDAGAAG